MTKLYAFFITEELNLITTDFFGHTLLQVVVVTCVSLIALYLFNTLPSKGLLNTWSSGLSDTPSVLFRIAFIIMFYDRALDIEKEMLLAQSRLRMSTLH